MKHPSILVVDDDSQAVLTLLRALKAAGLEEALHAAATPTKALELAHSEHPAVAIIDLSLDPARGVESGFELLHKLIEHDRTMRIVVLTGHGSLDLGVRALKYGAANFLEKPADIQHLVALIRDGLRQAHLRRSYDELSLHKLGSEISALVVGEHALTQKLRTSIQYVATSTQAVLFRGETGTGKGLCARAVHQFSARCAGRFVRYQPNYSSADLVNSALFGHTKGAFTGALEDRHGLITEAHAGTLFLDEIEALPLETQVSLLGVLQERAVRPVGASREHSVDFRLVSASNGDLQKDLAEGRLRQDFYHRIAHVVIDIPALRQRKADIPALARHVLERLQHRERVGVLDFDAGALDRLSEYDWPGNIRELEAVVEGGAYRAQFAARNRIASDDLHIHAAICCASTGASFHEQVESYRLRLINEALARHEGNQVKAAKELGLDRTSMRRIVARN